MIGSSELWVRPGTTVRLEAELLRLRGNFGKGKLTATNYHNPEEFFAGGEMTFGIVDRPAELG